MKRSLTPLIPCMMVFNIMILVVINEVYAEQVIVIIVPGASKAAEISMNAPQSQTSQTFGTYHPSPEVEIKPNTTVKWYNNDSVVHTIKSGFSESGPSGIFDSGIIDTGMSWNHTFTQNGTYPYFDSIYPTMQGKVIVGENLNRTNSGSDFMPLLNRNISNFTESIKGIQ